LTFKQRKVRKGTPGAKKVKTKSGKWYGRVPGVARNAAVPLTGLRLDLLGAGGAFPHLPLLDEAGALGPLGAGGATAVDPGIVDPVLNDGHLEDHAGGHGGLPTGRVVTQGAKG